MKTRGAKKDEVQKKLMDSRKRTLQKIKITTAKLRHRYRCMTKARYKETHNNKSPERTVRRIFLGKMQDVCFMKADAEGEADFDIEEGEEIRETEDVDIGDSRRAT
jgi:hypothetical protein